MGPGKPQYHPDHSFSTGDSCCSYGKSVGAVPGKIDARGCTLNQMLYFIGQGMPVAAYTDSGNYVLLYGYDQYNISVLNPATGETYKMGLNDGADYFNRCGNDFICGKVLSQ